MAITSTDKCILLIYFVTYLQASDDIRAGDTLISESPYAAVLLPENAHTHCDCCFEPLVAPFL